MISGKMYKMRTSSQVLPAFAEAWLLTSEAQKAVDRMKTGGSDSGLNLTQGRFLRLPFLLAPLPEQRRIVAKTEGLFAKLNEGVAALKRAEVNLERYRASVLKSAVEGRLTEQWRRENPPEETGPELLRRILAERRKRWEEEQLAKFAAKGRKPPKNWKTKYKEPVAPDTGKLPALPEGWCWATVDQVTAGNRTSAYGVLKPGPEVPGGIRLVRVGNIQDGLVSGQLKRIDPEIASRYARTRLCGGELLMTLVGAIGRTAVAPGDLSGANTARAVGVVPISSMLDARWIELWFRSPLQRLQMIGKAHEVARKTLNLEDLRSATVALPPGSEQRTILLAVEKATRGLTPTVEHLMNSHSYSAALRQSILKRAFDGRLVPQNPADEPASVLLERIRAAREAKRKRSKRGTPKPRGQRRSRVP
jgi:type I restriction enzyme S subunit